MELLALLVFAVAAGLAFGFGAGVGGAVYAAWKETPGGRTHKTQAHGGLSVVDAETKAGRDKIVEELADIATAYGGTADVGLRAVVNEPERLLKEHARLWKDVALRLVEDQAPKHEGRPDLDPPNPFAERS